MASSLSSFDKKFTFRLILIFLFSFVLIMTLFLLGIWQLKRASEKKQLLMAAQIQAKKIPMMWEPKHPLPQQYQRLKLKGYFLGQLYLLDNQFYMHQFGYHVLIPFVLENDQVVLIDGGWLKGDVTRKTLPRIDIPKQPLLLSGSVYYPTKNKMTLGAMIDKQVDNKIVIEFIEPELLSALAGKKIYPFTLRLDKMNAYGFQREWNIVSMSPERHYAYAFQWFAMAVASLVLIILMMKKRLK